ncbi:MAG: ATP-dependent helicase [Deltaproteobacteria bacterium]|nr:ATP-dependent helicase [Deltaproteobacteria bacterium]
MITLTTEQQEAVVYPGDSVIIAAPGSGKTEVLVRKVAYLYEQKKIPLDQIIVMTFTEKAAAELKGRLSSRLKRTLEQLERMPIGTMHSYLASLLRRHGNRLHLKTDFEIIDEAIAYLLRLKTCHITIQEALQQGEKKITQWVERFGISTSTKMAMELLTKELHFAETDGEAVLQRLHEAYETKKRERNLMDFKDLERWGLQLLRDRSIQKSIQQEIRWILIDEFQDTSLAQNEMADRLHDPTQNHLVFVGDPRQSIYRFRGAVPELFLRQTENLQKKGGKVFYLDSNFRSRPELIDYVNGISPKLFPDFHRPIIATRPSNQMAKVEYLEINSQKNAEEQRKAEAMTVAEKILLLREKNAWHEIVLLFRTRLAMRSYEEELNSRKIPFLTDKGESLLDQPESIAALFAMKHLLNRSDPYLLLGLESTPLRNLSLSLPEEGLTKWLPNLFKQLTGLYEGDSTAKNNLERFQEWLLELNRLDSPDLKGLLETVDLFRQEKVQIPSPDKESRRDAVRLMTVHSAKGLEFPIVFLCDLGARPTNSHLPYLKRADGKIFFKERSNEENGLKNKLEKSEEYVGSELQEKAAEQEESKRLLYVALTRAKEQLYLPISRPPKGNSPSHSWPSLLLNET